MNTFASVFVPADAQAAAQADLGEGFFTAALSADGAEPATYYWSSGYFESSELDHIVNEATWAHTVKFGDAQAALVAMGLQAVAILEIS